MSTSNYNDSLANAIKSLPLAKQAQVAVYSNFPNFSLEELILLISNRLDDGKTSENVVFAERLLRFCEFNLWNYKKKLAGKGIGAFRTRIFHHLLISFFLKEYQASGDYRYFNVALKLSDVGFSNTFFFTAAANKNVIQQINTINKALIEEILENE